MKTPSQQDCTPKSSHKSSELRQLTTTPRTGNLLARSGTPRSWPWHTPCVEPLIYMLTLTLAAAPIRIQVNCACSPTKASESQTELHEGAQQRRRMPSQALWGTSGPPTRRSTSSSHGTSQRAESRERSGDGSTSPTVRRMWALSLSHQSLSVIVSVSHQRCFLGTNSAIMLCIVLNFLDPLRKRQDTGNQSWNAVLPVSMAILVFCLLLCLFTTLHSESIAHTIRRSAVRYHVQPRSIFFSIVDSCPSNISPAAMISPLKHRETDNLWYCEEPLVRKHWTGT